MGDTDFDQFDIPRRAPFVLVGWGDTTGRCAQTVSIFYDNATPGNDYAPSGTSRLQRRMMALRLRHAADLVDPDNVQET